VYEIIIQYGVWGHRDLNPDRRISPIAANKQARIRAVIIEDLAPIGLDPLITPAIVNAPFHLESVLKQVFLQKPATLIARNKPFLMESLSGCGTPERH